MWIIATVSGIFLFLILLLAIPFDLVFHIQKDMDFQSGVRVRWLFGLIGKDISKGKKKPDKEERKKVKKKEKSTLKPLLTLLRNRDFLKKLTRLMKQVFPTLKIRELEVYLRIGLDNPADTGMLFAAVGPATLYMNSLSSLDVQIEPDFEQESLQGRIQGALRVIPIKLVKPVVLFVFSLTTLQMIKAMIWARRK